MKQRLGFVSNSSSSSFVVGGTFEDGVPVVKIDLSEFGELIRTEEELQAWAEDYYGEYDIDDYFTRKILKVLKSGKSAFVGNIDNEQIGILNYIQGDYTVDSDY